MNFRTAALTITFLFSIALAQHHCGQGEIRDQLKHDHPEIFKNIEAGYPAYQSAMNATRSGKTESVDYVIPVVFHIMHDDGTENISDDQIHDAMRIINDDFNKRNPLLGTVYAPFVSRIGDGKIEFRLAKLDPNGNNTTGIRRIRTNETYAADENSKLVVGGWPRESYLNIWVARSLNGVSSNTLAYALIPAVAENFPNQDGIMCRYSAVGGIGEADPDNASTLSHEIGHCLGLEHTWGQTNDPGLALNCNDDDGITDTPNTIGQLGGCNLTESSCGSTDNMQNMMNYSNCSFMFTEGQVNYMHNVLDNSLADRNQLHTANNLAATGVDELNFANFYSTSNTVCAGDTVFYTDRSAYGANTWNWTFDGGEVHDGNTAFPYVVYNEVGVYNVRQEVSNGTDTRSIMEQNYVQVLDPVGAPMPFMEDFENVSNLAQEGWVPYNAYFDNYEFELSNSVGFSGNKSIMFDNFGNAMSTTDYLHSLSLDLGVFTSANITFNYAYARRSNSSADQMIVELSTDCGENWAPRFQQAGSQLATVSTLENSDWSPSSTSDWESVTLPAVNGALLSEATQMRFVFNSFQGNNLFIDDINITGTWVDVAQLRYPRDGQSGLSEDVQLNWKDIGNTNQYEYEVDTDASFSTPELITGVKDFISTDPTDDDTWLSLDGLTHGGTYFWRVRLIKNGTPEAWSDTWSFTIADNGVDVEERAENQFGLKVYPNPTHDQINIELDVKPQDQFSIQLTDLNGHVLFQESKRDVSGKYRSTLLEPNLAAGVYVVLVTVNDQSYSKRLIVR